ncbi:MAG: hypothetical protein NTX49_07645 [Chlamydiae bacterium]|nr:hypothetical protein [Chlamydiota bacterium]
MTFLVHLVRLIHVIISTTFRASSPRNLPAAKEIMIVPGTKSIRLYDSMRAGGTALSYGI